MTKKQRRPLALADGLYWMAEKLAWGYEGVDKNPTEALRLKAAERAA